MTPDHGADQDGVGRATGRAKDAGDAASFDAVLRIRRRALGLTQSELAARAGIGVRTVRDLERGRSSRPQRTTVELLANALGLTGSDRVQFLALARGQGGAADRSTARPLPVLGALIGRDRDVAEVAELVTTGHAVVTLVGLAGVGKSSLALAVTHHVADRFPGGVAGIVVGEVSTEPDVLAAVASVFGVGRSPDLVTRFAEHPSLLLVDAVERAPGPVAKALRWLTREAPALRVLATGRHPIGLPGERVWPVAPLEVPPADTQADLATVSAYPAVALFLARLRQVRREPPAGAEVGALVGLVRRLGGLPLALELAAARGRVLDLNEILNRYGDRVLDLSGQPAPHEAAAITLRDAVAASYRLLDATQRYALRRLSVFRNRWSVELAEALLTDERQPDGGSAAGDPVPLLDRMMALGLVSVRGSGPARFRLLDVVRDFALEQAAASGELAAARRQHAVVLARVAARLAPELAGGQLRVAVTQLDDLAMDLWSALAYSANDDPHTALCLASKLPRWWRFRGRDVPGRQWLRRLLDDPRTADADPAVRAWAKLGVAQLALEHGAGREELPAAQEALAEFEDLGDVTGELAARSLLCAAWMTVGGYDEARRHGEAMLALATRTGRVRDMTVAQNNLTWHEIRVGDLVAARQRLAAVDRLAAQCGEDRLRALARANLAEVERLDGRYAEAEALARQVVPVLEEVGDPGHRRRVLTTIGLALAQSGRTAAAEEVVSELRAGGGGLAGSNGSAGDEGACAWIEAHLALRRGDRAAAAELFTAAADAYAGRHDLRDVAEALVGLVATADERTSRERALAWLSSVCRDGGITLLPGERALLGPEGRRFAVPAQRAAAEPGDRAEPS
ncbi:MAG TPA: helix-turn-helix domain-containing protein [Micromonosporaceae bacterium]|nr:helix-turn-helix domain-containing protein [Micromonosporaceae bacterium]